MSHVGIAVLAVESCHLLYRLLYELVKTFIKCSFMFMHVSKPYQLLPTVVHAGVVLLTAVHVSELLCTCVSLSAWQTCMDP